MAVFLCQAMCSQIQVRMFPFCSFDKAASAEKVILIDASKLGEEYKEGKNKKT